LKELRIYSAVLLAFFLHQLLEADYLEREMEAEECLDSHQHLAAVIDYGHHFLGGFFCLNYRLIYINS
jgi:hypothetical protein